MQYLLVSMKHTGKKDLFVTFWAKNNSGYSLSLDNCGVYEELEEGYHNSEHTLPIEKDKAEKLFALYHYGYEQKMMVPNCQAVWNELGLKQTKEGLRRI
jgi:hypothetical protein